MVELQNKGPFRRKLSILLGCGIALVLIVALWGEREPRYAGDTLSQWVYHLELTDARYPEGSPLAIDAIQHIGTNALPFLIKWIQYEERPWRTRLNALCSKLPQKLADRFGYFFDGRLVMRRAGAFRALYVLGPDAAPAIPTLKMLVEKNSSTVGYSVTVLAHLGDAGLPTVLTVLTNPAQPAAVRMNAMFEIGNSWAQFSSRDTVAAALVACLDDKDGKVAITAATALCSGKCERDHAIQTFLRVINDPNKMLAKDAIWGLQRGLQQSFPRSELIQFLHDTNSPLSAYVPGAFTDMTDTPVIPILTNSLHDPRPSVRSSAAIALGPFGRPAEPAAPALLDAWNDPDLCVRRAATNAFFELPSYKVLRHADQLSPLPPGMNDEQTALYQKYWPDSSLLVRLLDHPDPRVREMATNAVRKFKDAGGELPTAQLPRR